MKGPSPLSFQAHEKVLRPNWKTSAKG